MTDMAPPSSREGHDAATPREVAAALQERASFMVQAYDDSFAVIIDSERLSDVLDERERAAWAATELGLQRDELQRRLSLASKALVWFFDDHVEEGDPPCPCTGCERARLAFKANLEPLPEASRG